MKDHHFFFDAERYNPIIIYYNYETKIIIKKKLTTDKASLNGQQSHTVAAVHI